MAIKSGDFIGTFTGTNGVSWPVYAVAFGSTGKLYPGQEVEVNGVKGYVIRSRNFVKAANPVFKQADGITDDLVTSAFEASGESDTQGFLPPAGFTTPMGWAARSDGYGTTYYVNLEDLNLDGVPDSQTGLSSWSAAKAWDFVKTNWVYFAIGAAALYLIVVSQMSSKRKRKKYSFGIL
jgi:hypothetical protein